MVNINQLKFAVLFMKRRLYIQAVLMEEYIILIIRFLSISVF